MIEHVTSRKRLNEAVDFYNKALQEDDYVAERRNSINNRINAIRGMASIYDKYEGICDSLEMAIEDGAEIQSEILKEKQDIISNQIKKHIIEL